MEKTPGAVTGSSAERKSDRIRYAYRLRITGKDSSGVSFDEPARTEIITRDGGLMVATSLLVTGTVLRISRGAKVVEARVVGQCGLRGEEFLYGVEFVGAPVPPEPFWDVNFPPVKAENSVGKMVLQCSRCSRQDLFYLSEVELMVYENMKVVPRQCVECKLETLWLEPEILGEVASGSAAYDVRGELPARRPRTINDRKHARIHMRNIKACLHRTGQPDDIVAVTDISRGGIGFMSYNDYFPGTQIQVAVPFTEGAANVFTHAKIVRVRCRPTADIPGEFGLAYVKS